MITLLINDPVAEERATDQTVFGGRPSAPQGRLMWPACKACGGAMQFLGQLRSDAPAGPELLLLFMCRNKPGMCSEWHADAGGNAVVVTGTEHLQLVDPPPQAKKSLRQIRYSAKLLPIEEAPDYESAAAGWADATGTDLRQLLGQVSDSPAWVEYEEIPTCDACGEPMQFVAQLEQGPDRKTEMNFGGGWAYVFRCGCAARRAKMLWQC